MHWPMLTNRYCGVKSRGLLLQHLSRAVKCLPPHLYLHSQLANSSFNIVSSCVYILPDGGWSVKNWKGFGRKWLWYNQSTVLAFARGVWGKAWSISSQDTKCPVCDTNRTHPTWSLECCYVCSVGFQKCKVSSTGPLLYEPGIGGLVGCVCVSVCVCCWTLDILPFQLPGTLQG